MPETTRPIRLLPVLGLLLLGLAYVPATQNSYVWDDDTWLTHNPVLEGPNALWRIWFTAEPVQYYPLLFTSFLIEKQIWGMHPLGYHLVNIALHLLNGVLIFLLLQRLGASARAAWITAALFIVHPMHVESVAWITERKNVMSVAFYLGAWLAFLRSLRQGGWRWYGLSLGLFLCAMLTKTAVCTLPAAILVVWWALSPRRHGEERLLAMALRLTPFFVLGAGLGLLAAWWEYTHVMAQGEQWAFPFVERLLIASRALLFYPFKLVWPHPLIFFYPRWEIENAPLVAYWPMALALLALATLIVFRRHVPRAVWAGLGYYVVTLFPALGFFNVYAFRYSFVADHFAYPATLGLLALAGLGLAWLTRRLPAPGVAATALLIVVLAILTALQCQKYRSEETLWEATLAANPQAWMVHNNLGLMRVHQGRASEAIMHLEQAIELNPNLGEAHYNLGTLRFQQGYVTRALESWERAARLQPGRPDAHERIGDVLMAEGDHLGAIHAYRRAIEEFDGFARIHFSLGRALRHYGDLDASIAAHEEAIERAPDLTAARFDLALLLQMRERTPAALDHLEYILAQEGEDPDLKRIQSRAAELASEWTASEAD